MKCVGELKEEVIDELFDGSAYQPDSDLRRVVTAKLMKLSLSDLHGLKMILETKSDRKEKS